MRRGKRNLQRRDGCSKELGYGLVSFLLILLIYHALGSFFYQSDDTVSDFSGSKAAIVDQLSLTIPNQTFVETATYILEQAGFEVRYYSGEKATVELYRKLPTHGYDLIILRVHSTATLRSGAGYIEAPVVLFTSEPVSKTKYVYERLTHQLRGVIYLPYSEGDLQYFGIAVNFVREGMNGRFDNTTVIMMGCEGLRNVEMAQAFLDRGAKAYISWNGSVQAEQTDQATVHLLQHLVIEKHTIKEAVERTVKEAGSDPISKSVLLYYPSDAGDYTVRNMGDIAVDTTLFFSFFHKSYR